MTTLPGPQGDDAGPPADTGAPEDTGSPEATALLVPRDGVPPVVESAAALADVVGALRRRHRPGRRRRRARLGLPLQPAGVPRAAAPRRGAGTALIDPIACPDLSGLSGALSGVEWVLHAASQDLPCLAEVGLVPSAVFDTELGGRLAGFERVGLGAMVENVLGLRLEKGHSAADWSTRPLPESWLVYAALDVEVLVELRDALEAELASQGKLAWAHEEFEAVRLAPPPPPRAEPWRRTSGLHRLRTRRQLAAVRALWEARDAMARRRDTAPGRVLPDAAIVGAVTANPTTPDELLALPVFGGRSTRRHVDTWFGALASATALADSALPATTATGDGPPPQNRWAERDPVAAARLARARAVVTAVSTSLSMPPENLLQPDAVRRLAWTPPADGQRRHGRCRPPGERSPRLAGRAAGRAAGRRADRDRPVGAAAVAARSEPTRTPAGRSGRPGATPPAPATPAADPVARRPRRRATRPTAAPPPA